MPRGSDGGYNLPSGTLVSSGDTILVSQHNPAMSDIAQALTNSLDRYGSGGMLAALPMNGNKITGGAPGVASTDFATVGQLSSGGAGVPVGSVIDYAGPTAPTGWLVCNGQSVSRTTYADLFAAIGTTYGSVDSSNFNLPDFRGRVAAGIDSGAARLSSTTMTPNASTLGASGGIESVTLTIPQIPAHTHTGSTASAGDHSHTYGVSVLGGTDGARAGVSPGEYQGTTNVAGAHTHTMNLDNTGGGGAHPNVQPTLLINKIIRTGVS